jgi:hypothetical protein
MALGTFQPDARMSEMDRTFLARMLSQSVGEQKATEVVNATADRLGYNGMLTEEQAMALLEKVAGEPGIVGVAARFARSRLILRRA